MEFVNATSASALYFDSADQFGALFHIVVVRQRFMIAPDGLMAAPVQPAVRDSDAEFLDGPSGLVYQESDLCPYKPCCDVSVNAVAYAPRGPAVPRVQVRLRVDPAPLSADPAAPLATPLIDKSLVITGERRIVRKRAAARAGALLVQAMTLGFVRLPAWTVTPPAPFLACPVRYDYAYGGENKIAALARDRDRARQVRGLGADNCLTPAQATLHPDAGVDGRTVPLAHTVCEANPVGCGYATDWYLRGSGVTSLAAPRIEYPGQPLRGREFLTAAGDVTRIWSAGFGVVGRAWQPRRSLVGVIAEKDDWAENEFPSLPAEFDHRYWNHAPQDQQCAHLRGDEIITLTNLSPARAAQLVTASADATVQRFQLPGVGFYLAIRDAHGRVADKPCALDTVSIDPESSTVDLVWRAAISADVEPERIRLCVANVVEALDVPERLMTQTLVAESVMEA